MWFKTISKSLNKAKYYYATGNSAQALSSIYRGLSLSKSGEYTYENARLTIELLLLLKQICNSHNIINKDDLVTPILNALEQVPYEGSRLDINTQNLQKFIKGLAKDIKNKTTDSFNQFTEELDNTHNVPNY